MYETTPGKSAGLPFGRPQGLIEWTGTRIRTVPFEAVVWIVGVGAMALMNPTGDHLLSLCPLDAIGVSFCPGCGLGHAVAYLARGEIAASISAHPLGIPAVLILGTHTTRLLWSAGGHQPHNTPS